MIVFCITISSFSLKKTYHDGAFVGVCAKQTCFVAPADRIVLQYIEFLPYQTHMHAHKLSNNHGIDDMLFHADP